MAFRGLSPRRLGPAAKPPGELSWFAAPAEPSPGPDSAAEVSVDVGPCPLDRQDRDRLIFELRQLGKTNKEIGATIGVSRETVRQVVETSVRQGLWSGHDLPQVVTGSDGKRYPAKKAPKRGTPGRKAEDAG